MNAAELHVIDALAAVKEVERKLRLARDFVHGEKVALLQHFDRAIHDSTTLEVQLTFLRLSTRTASFDRED